MLFTSSLKLCICPILAPALWSLREFPKRFKISLQSRNWRRATLTQTTWRWNENTHTLLNIACRSYFCEKWNFVGENYLLIFLLDSNWLYKIWKKKEEDVKSMMSVVALELGNLYSPWCISLRPKNSFQESHLSFSIPALKQDKGINIVLLSCQEAWALYKVALVSFMHGLMLGLELAAVVECHPNRQVQVKHQEFHWNWAAFQAGRNWFIRSHCGKEVQINSWSTCTILSHERKKKTIYNYVAVICLMAWRTIVSRYIDLIPKGVMIIHPRVHEGIQKHKIPTVYWTIPVCQALCNALFFF